MSSTHIRCILEAMVTNGVLYRLSKITELSWADWFTLSTALLCLPFINLGLRFWGFRRLYAILVALSPTPDKSSSLSDIEARRTARMIDVAANRGLWRFTCLRRSMLTWWLLRWRGAASELRIGVLRENGEFLAHAWVERDAVVINDVPNIGERFFVLEPGKSVSGMTWI